MTIGPVSYTVIAFPGNRFNGDIAPEVAGVYPSVMIKGEMDAGGWSCGMVAGLIHDVPTVKELIERTIAEATQIIRERLEKMLDA